MKPHQDPIKAAVAAVCLVAVLGAAAYGVVRYQANNSLDESTEVVQVTPSVQATVSPTAQATPEATERVVYWAQQGDKITAGESTYYQQRLYRKIGNGDAELVYTIGTSKEMPAGSAPVIDANNKYAAFSVENRLFIVDLSTKKQVYTHTFNGDAFGMQRLAFSPDGKQAAFISGVETASGVKGSVRQFTVYTVDLSTMKETKYHNWEATQVNTPDAVPNPQYLGGDHTVVNWTGDDKLVIQAAGGEVSVITFFDMKTKKLTEKSYQLGLSENDYDALSNLVYNQISTTPTSPACVGMTSTIPDGFKLVSPNTGDQVGTYGQKGKRVELLAVSPDQTEVLYRASDIATTEATCPSVLNPVYYHGMTKTGEASVVTAAESLTFAKKWGNPTGVLLAISNYDSQSNLVNTDLFIGGEKITTANGIQPVKAFWR